MLVRHRWGCTAAAPSQESKPAKKVSFTMSATVDHVASEESASLPTPDMSSPPPYSCEEQEPPPYSEAPPGYPPTKMDANSICQADTVAMNPEDPTEATAIAAPSAFEDKTVRRGFIRKVFSILTLQLLFTFTVVCVFTFSSVVKEAVRSNIWAYVSSYIIFIVVATALAFCKSFSRRHPWNIVGLVVVTISLSYMVGTVASFHDTSAVIITMGATLAITLAIIIYSAQTRYDFTICYGMALVLGVDLIMFGFFSIFYYSVVTEIVYGCLGALLYSLFLMIDCQLMMGTMSNRVDPEEYITAALVIYLDVVLIFLYLLGRK